MATYTIRVLNSSKSTKSYAIFSKPPKVDGLGTDAQIFSNAWVTFNGIKNGGHDKVVYHEETFAYWAKLPSALDKNTIVSSGGDKQVDTTERDSVTFSGLASSKGFGDEVIPKLANTGSYQIVADSNFEATDNYVFGMAKDDGTEIPAPVATFPATPGDTFDVAPVVHFYVSEGIYTPGQVIDVKEHATDAAEIDFTGKQETTATVVQDEHGKFKEVHYS